MLVAGGKIIYAHPEILKDESDRICAQALSSLAPAAEVVARAAGRGRRMEPLRVSCPVAGCEAEFTVRALSPAEGEDLERQKAEKEKAEASVAPPPASSPAVRRPSGVIRRLEGLAKSEAGAGPFLSRLEPGVIDEIVGLATVEEYAEPTVIIREGQEGTALYIVAEGEVEVVRRGEAGREVILASVGKGECLGEMSLLTGLPASATVRTHGAATVLVVPKRSFEELLVRKPTLHREFSRIIAERLYSTNVKLEAETSHGIAGRLSMIGIVDLVQTLNASRRTGTLSLEDGSGISGRVGFREGQVVSAVVGEVPGAEGFYGLLGWQDGNFTFEGGEPQMEDVPGSAVQGDVMALLMEGMRRLDEKRRV